MLQLYIKTHSQILNIWYRKLNLKLYNLVVKKRERKYKTLGDMIYDHDNKGCPDLKDSVYLTPTSKNPFDPLPLKCILATRSGKDNFELWGLNNWDFKWPKRYDHKKFDESDNWKKEYYCNYQFSEYAELNWFKYWCPMGLFIWSENIDPITGTCK